MKDMSSRLFVSCEDGIKVVPSFAASGAACPETPTRDATRVPMHIFWEITKACALACRHCRAGTISTVQADELTTMEGKRLLREIASFGDPLPHLTLTGGDPLKRPDLYDLMDEAHQLGLTISVTPSVTPGLTFGVLARLKGHHVHSIGLSLDGSCPALNDSVRGVRGCFGWSIRAANDAAQLQIPVQVNTLVSCETVEDLPAIYELLKSMNIMRWQLYFLIGVGRGKMLQPISPERGEALMDWIYGISNAAPFLIGTAEAPSFRRVALNRMRADGMASTEIQHSAAYGEFGIRDGHGAIFVAHNGTIYPAGFLPLSAGNVRLNHLVDVYRTSEIFRALRKPNRFKGKCGRCEYRALCGGSRARAFVSTGDPLESDPFCPYEPKDHAAHCVGSATR